MDSLLNTIFAGINGSKHILHLYAPSVNKYALHAAFLSGRKGSTAYVTAEKPDLVFEQLDFLANKPDILYPLKLNKIKEYANAVIDAATINPELAEKKLVAGGGNLG